MTRIETYKKALEFEDKVLFLTAQLRHRNRCLVDLLEETVACFSQNLAQVYKSACHRDIISCKVAVWGNCLKCGALLFFLRKRGAIGKLTYAVLKADIEKITDIVEKELLCG